MADNKHLAGGSAWGASTVLISLGPPFQVAVSEAEDTSLTTPCAMPKGFFKPQSLTLGTLEVLTDRQEASRNPTEKHA